MSLSAIIAAVEVLLSAFDTFMYIREQVINNVVSHLFGGIYLFSIILVAVVLLAYWGCCAVQILSSDNDDLTDAELDALSWDHWLRFVIWLLFHPGQWIIE